MFDISTEQKTLSVMRLKELLQELQDDDILVTNAVGNLAVLRTGIFVGFIDFNSEEVEINP